MICWGKEPLFIPSFHFKISLQPEPTHLSHTKLNLSEAIVFFCGDPDHIVHLCHIWQNKTSWGWGIHAAFSHWAFFRLRTSEVGWSTINKDSITQCTKPRHLQFSALHYELISILITSTTVYSHHTTPWPPIPPSIISRSSVRPNLHRQRTSTYKSQSSHFVKKSRNGFWACIY